MLKKLLIKHLQSIPGNPEIGINVLTNKGSEFWGFSKANFKPMDKGTTYALHQIRLKDPIPRRILATHGIFSCVSVDCTKEDIKRKIDERYDIVGNAPDDMTETEALELIFDVIMNDLEELLRMRDDFLALLANDEFKKKYCFEQIDHGHDGTN